MIRNCAGRIGAGSARTGCAARRARRTVCISGKGCILTLIIGKGGRGIWSVETALKHIDIVRAARAKRADPDHITRRAPAIGVCVGDVATNSLRRATTDGMIVGHVGYFIRGPNFKVHATIQTIRYADGRDREGATGRIDHIVKSIQGILIWRDGMHLIIDKRRIDWNGISHWTLSGTLS